VKSDYFCFYCRILENPKAKMVPHQEIISQRYLLVCSHFERFGIESQWALVLESVGRFVGGTDVVGSAQGQSLRRI
jgi:hypothetical protein